MPSIEVEARSLKCRALVVARLCDASAQVAWHEGWDHRERETNFWHGIEGLMLEVVSFFERLPSVVPMHVLNCEMPPEGSPFYDPPDERDVSAAGDESSAKKEGDR